MVPGRAGREQLVSRIVPGFSSQRVGQGRPDVIDIPGAPVRRHRKQIVRLAVRGPRVLIGGGDHQSGRLIVDVEQARREWQTDELLKGGAISGAGAPKPFEFVCDLEQVLPRDLLLSVPDD